MSKLISTVVAGVIGVALAAVAAFSVVSTQTGAPSNNPAQGEVVNYGQ